VSTTAQTCIRGCSVARQHAIDCDSDQCRGCLPRPATNGLLCYPCHSRLANLVRAIAVQHELLLVTAGKSHEQVLTVETTARTHQPPRVTSDGKYSAPFARTTTASMSQSEPVRLAALDAADELSDWLSQVVETIVQAHDLTGPKRLTTKGDPRQWKWHALTVTGAVSDFDPIVRHGFGRDAMRGQYLLTDPPARFEVKSAAGFLLAWLDRFEVMDCVGDELESFGAIMSQCHSLAPWREEMARLTGIPCPACHANALARFGGDENVTCIRCNESIPPERYGLWVRMLADANAEEEGA